MVLPNFIGIGAPRAGSTWLDAKLRAHPDVYLPTWRKELMFFDRNFHRGMSWYRSCFEDEKAEQCRAVGEISPRYFAHPDVPERIKDRLDRCRFLLILRDPVDRAYSEYKYSVQAYNENRDFLGYLKAHPEVVDESRYDVHLGRWLAFFPIEDFLVLTFEEVIAEPEQGFARLAAFLGIDERGFDPHPERDVVNPSFLPRFRPLYTVAKRTSRLLRHNNADWLVKAIIRSGLPKLFTTGGRLPGLDEDDRKKVDPMFDESIARLETLARRDLGVWRTHH